MSVVFAPTRMVLLRVACNKVTFDRFAFVRSADLN